MAEETLDTSAPPQNAPSKEKKPFDPEKLIGKTLAGRYEVKKCIGRGGMGVVYLARQTALGRKVVIKVLPRSFVDDEEAIIRFEREAQGMSRLQHPHIVAIYDFGHDADQAYICMEYIDGETLTARIRREGPTSAQEFAQIASQILQGIGEAHSMGLIHRDIKPTNIMLTERHGRQNYAKILDFGLAKLSAGAVDVTKEQALVGSAAYLSPEQIMGHPSDHRADIYAMGVLFYYMLCGEKPFVSDDDITVLYQHVHQAPQPLIERLPEDHRIPAEIIDLVERMLAKSPKDRPPDAPSILGELVEIMAATSIHLPNLAAQITTGEYPRTTPSGVHALEDPSAQLRQKRAHTPRPAPDSNSHPQIYLDESGAYRDSNSDMRFITEEQITVMQKAQTRKTIRIAALALALILAGVAAAVMLYSPVEDRPAATLEATRAQLEQAGAYIEQKNFGRAETILDLVEPTLTSLPELKPDYAASRDDLATGRLFSKAEIFEEKGQPERALEVYEQLRQQNPANARARAAVERLSAVQQTEPEPASAASKTAEAQPPAERADEKTSAVEADDTPSKKRARRKPSPRKKAKTRPAPASAKDSAERNAKPDADEAVTLLPIGEAPGSSGSDAPKEAEEPSSDAPQKDNDDDSVPLLTID